MPRPGAGESKEDYVKRFMASPEARTDYPHQDQRYKVAISLWEHRNVLQNSASGEWPRPMKGKHLEPGLVRYTLNDAKTGQTVEKTYLLPKEAIDRMRPTFYYKPLVNEQHAKVNPDWFKSGEADGIVVPGGEFSAADGWDWVHFIVWDEDTKRNCENGYELSCAYIPTEIDETPGLHHNVPYDAVILNGVYTHLAVVPDPRYRGATIHANSKGDAMTKSKFTLVLEKLGIKNSIEVDPAAVLVKVDEKDVSLLELVNAKAAEDAAKAKITVENASEHMNDDTMVDVDGKGMRLGDLKCAYRNMMERKNAEEAEKKRKEDEEKKNAEEAAAKKKADEDAEREKKNASDAAAKKAADDKAKKDEEHFNDLRKKANERGGAPVGHKRMSDSDKEAEGARKYGAAKK